MNEKISLQDLVVLLAEKSNLNPKDAETLVKECFDIMEEGLVKDKFLKVRNLGTFKLVWVEDSESIDASTGEQVFIPAHYKVTFTPDIELSEIVNAPYASMETTEIEGSGYREKIEDALDDSDDEAEDDVNENPAKSGYFWSRPETQKQSESTGAEVEPKKEEQKPEVVAKPEKPQEEPEITEVKPEEPEKEPEIIEVKPEEPEVMEIEKEKPEDKKEEEFEDKEEYIEDRANEFENEEEPEYNEPYNEDHSRIRANKGLFWFLVLIFGLTLFFCGRYFYFKMQTPVTSDSISIFSSSSSQLERSDADSLETAQEDGSATKEALDAQAKDQPAQKAESRPAKSYINDYYTILPGERLNTIALREYGHKAFWVYIYDENREIIDDPDVVEPGTVVYIPPEGKYGIDKDDPYSVEKALVLQQQYKRR